MLKARVFPNYKYMYMIRSLSLLLTHVVCMETYIIMSITSGLRKTGYDVDFIVGVGCYYFHA